VLSYSQDANGSPTLDILTERYEWDNVQAHVGLTHRPTLAPMPRSDQYRGVFWNGSAVDLFTQDLGSDPAAAAATFRALLAERPAAASPESRPDAQ
jgi:hypothetical protein